MKADPVQTALDRLAELRRAETSDSVVDEIRRLLANRSNLVVAKAAKVVGELRLNALTPDLAAAFDRFIANAPKLDKRCAAITAILSTLYELDYDEPAPYLKGLKHVQLEASYGPPVDEAAKLRGLSAQGLLRTRHADALAEVVPLLVDKEPAARIGAVRALATNGGEAGLLLLRLKVLTGDLEPEVLSECFAGMLAASPTQSLHFVASYIDSEDSAISDAAILALGESRMAAAFEILKEKWDRTARQSNRKVLLASMAASRLEEAIAFLISLIQTSNIQTAADVIEALAVYRQNERVSHSVHGAVTERRDKHLTETFANEFTRS